MEMLTLSKKMVVVFFFALVWLLLVGCKHVAPVLVEDTDAIVADDEMDDDADADDADDLDDEMDDDADDDANDELVADVVIDVVGSNFAFDVETIEVNEGDVVTINFISEQGFHDWVVDEFNAATKQVNPGEPTSVTFVADTAGTYEYYCSVGQHRANGMIGILIVN